MKNEIKNKSKSEIELEIEVSAEEFDEFFKKATEQAGRDLEVSGFRKGMAPKEVVEEKVGRENILVEAANLAIAENYKKAILENKIEAISQPKIDILKLVPGNPFIFKATTSVLPEIDLPDYKKIAKKIGIKEISVEEKEIDNSLRWLQKSRAKLTIKNEPAQKGDFVEIEYSSPQIEDLGEKGVKKDAFILGEGNLIPGFEDKIIGAKAGEKKSFSLDVPENHPLSKKLNSPKIGFNLELKSVQNVELPEINDEFARSLGNFDNLAAFKNNIKQGLILEKEQAEAQRIRNEILEKISQTVNFDIPALLVEREQRTMMDNFKKWVADNMKIDFKDYLDKIGKTEEKMFDSFRKESEKRVKTLLILREIGKKEKIEVSDEEVRNQANEILKHYPSPKGAEKSIDFEQLKEYSRELLRNEKIFKLLENCIKK